MSEKKIVKLEEIENPSLVYAMFEMKEKKTREAEAKFIEELKKATFISPAIVEIKGEDGEFRLSENSEVKGETRINFMMLASSEGGTYLPAFTSMDQLRLWRKENKIQTLVCGFEHYVNVIGTTDTAENTPQGLAIDPFGSNILLSRELISGLKKVIDERERTQVYIRDLDETPEDIVTELKGFFDENGTVKQAYLMLMKRGETTGYLLIVDNDLPEGADDEKIKEVRKTLFDSIAEKVKPLLRETPLSIAGFADEFGKQAVVNKTPFYTR